MACSRKCATWACRWSRSLRSNPTSPSAHQRALTTHQSNEGDRHGHHRPSPGNENAGEKNPDELDKEDRARRGRLLLDHLHLDPHTRPLRPREEPPGLDPQLRLSHWCARGRLPRGDHGPRLHRHRRQGMIFTGVISLLSLVSLRQDLGGAGGASAAALVTTGASHVAIYNWTFLLGQTLMPGINALLLGSLLYRSRLVPRVIPVLGLIGAPLLITAVIATLFEQHSSL